MELNIINLDTNTSVVHYNVVEYKISSKTKEIETKRYAALPTIQEVEFMGNKGNEHDIIIYEDHDGSLQAVANYKKYDCAITVINNNTVGKAYIIVS